MTLLAFAGWSMIGAGIVCVALGLALLLTPELFRGGPPNN